MKMRRRWKLEHQLQTFWFVDRLSVWLNSFIIFEFVLVMKETLVSGLLGCFKCVMALADADDLLATMVGTLFTAVDS
jgi:hypothetical protein